MRIYGKENIEALSSNATGALTMGLGFAGIKFIALLVTQLLLVGVISFAVLETVQPIGLWRSKLKETQKHSTSGNAIMPRSGCRDVLVATGTVTMIVGTGISALLRCLLLKSLVSVVITDPLNLKPQVLPFTLNPKLETLNLCL